MSSLHQWFDVHTHTQFVAFEKDQDAVIQRALDVGVWMVNVGTQHDTSTDAIKTAERYANGVYATVGLHPIHTDKSYHDEKELGMDQTFTSRGEKFDYDVYKSLALHPKVVAIGEFGLDYYRLTGETKQKQFAAFDQQFALSCDVKKPLMIHCRNAFDDLIPLLEERRNKLLDPPGIIHFFSGTLEHTKRLLDLGFSFSFGGVITFARDYDSVIGYIPVDHIVLETDAPYVTPVPYRGKRNEPVYVMEVAKKLAELKKTTYEYIAEKTTQNAKRMFRFSE